jgi:PAS domain S-box-containing protein
VLSAKFPGSFHKFSNVVVSSFSSENQLLLQAACEQVNVPVLITDAELDLPGPKIIFVNTAFTKMTGYTSAEVVGQTPRILQGAKTDREALKVLRERLSKGEIFQGETYNYRKDGSAYFLEWHISPIKNAAGVVTHFVSVQNDVTARKQFEAIAREAQEYKNLFNLVHDSIIVYDPNARTVLSVNDTACHNYQISRESFIGLPLETIFDHNSQDKRMLAQLLTTGKIDEYESSHLRADGTAINVVVNSSLVEYQGKPAVLSINRDVTDKYRAEREIKKARDEWTDTVDAVSDLIILADGEGRIRRCNKATSDFFNLPYTALIGNSLDNLFWQTNLDPDPAKAINFNIEFGSSGKRPTWEEQLPGRDEWFEFSSHPVTSTNESEQGWVHIVKDISERKMSEAALKRLGTAIEQAADGIAIIDVEGKVQYVNPSFEQITGYSQRESVGQKLIAISGDILSDESSAQIYKTVAAGKVWNGTFRARRQGGEFYDQEISVSPVRDAGGNLLNYVLICRDTTEKRRLESIAEAVNMMENVGFIFSGIRHELGNPINSVKTALSVLQKNLNVWEKQQTVTYIERCLMEIGRVEYLLRALKTFSMHENPRMQPLPILAFMQNFISLIEGDYVRRGITIKLNKTEVGEALCDPRALHQVMLNLIANAGDALEKSTDAKICISLNRDERFVYVSVKDNGAGMTELQMENLFKPFYTSKPDGTGLGLVIVKKMIAKMNGTISVQSKHHVGTTVKFTLEAAKKG